MAARKFLTDIELDGYFDLKGNVAKKFRLEDYADNSAPTSNFIGRMIYTTGGTDRIEVYTDGGWKELAFVDELSSGSVTSVGLSLPDIFSVSNSPVTSTGTLTATLATQAANKVFAGPATGSSAAPTFRSLVAADIPDLSDTYLTSADLSGYVTETGYETLSHKIISGDLKFVDGVNNYANITPTGNDLGIYAHNDLTISSGYGDIVLNPDGFAYISSVYSGNEIATQGWVQSQSYLTSETDPVYTASSWYTTTNNSNDWDTAYSWGNHASAGYLTVAVESISNTDGNISFSSSTGAVTADLATNVEIAGDLTVQGDLTVNGTTTTLNTETLAVEDNVVMLNSSVTGSPSANAGIEVERGTSTNAAITWDESADIWRAGLAGTEYPIARKYATSINTTATSAYTVTHGLGTSDVIVQTYLGNSMIECDIDITSSDTITVTTNTSETGIKVVVIG